MWRRPQTIAQLIVTSFKGRTDHPRVLVVGAGFKKGQALTTHSPSVDLISALQDLGGRVSYVDPLVSQSVLPFVVRLDEKTQWTEEYLQINFDQIVVAVKQTGLDYTLLQRISIPVQNYVS
jgi:UDP-N-acetyl-D-mannosaminuronate dehydrogenase